MFIYLFIFLIHSPAVKTLPHKSIFGFFLEQHYVLFFLFCSKKGHPASSNEQILRV